MGILTWILFGMLAGWLAGLVVGDTRPRGCLTNMVTGIIGALLGGFIYRLATGSSWTFGFDFASFGVAVLGAIGLIVIINLVSHQGGRR